MARTGLEKGPEKTISHAASAVESVFSVESDTGNIGMLIAGHRVLYEGTALLDGGEKRGWELSVITTKYGWCSLGCGISALMEA